MSAQLLSYTKYEYTVYDEKTKLNTSSLSRYVSMVGLNEALGTYDMYWPICVGTNDCISTSNVL